MVCQLSDNQSESCLIAGLSLPSEESFWYFKRSCQTGNSKGCYHTYERYAIQENISEGVPFSLKVVKWATACWAVKHWPNFNFYKKPH